MIIKIKELIPEILIIKIKIKIRRRRRSVCVCVCVCCGSMKMNRELTRGMRMECVVPVKWLRGSDTR